MHDYVNANITYFQKLMLPSTWHLLMSSLQGWSGGAPIALEGRLHPTLKMTQRSNIYHEGNKVHHSIRLSKLTLDQGFANQS